MNGVRSLAPSHAQPGVEADAYPDERAGAQVKALVVEMHAGDDLDVDDRRDCPIDDETEGRPPACVGNKLTAVLPEVLETVASETADE
jgi:hypothetical protein